MRDAVKFSVYTIECETKKVAGIARYPEVFRDRLGDECTFAVRIRDTGFDIARAALDEIVRQESHERAEEYSLLDDGDAERGDETLVADYVPAARGKPFASAEASAELQWALLRQFPFHDAPPGDIMDFLRDAFRRLCVSSSTTVAYCMVYNAKKKKMVLKQADGAYEETTPTDFADRVAPWFVDAVLNAMRLAVERGTDHARDIVRRLQRVVWVDRRGTIVTLSDAIAGHAPMKKLQRRKLAGEHAAFRKFAMQVVQESADADHVITYEKLKHMYPPGHADAPDSKKHLKKCREMRTQRDIELLGPAAGEWFKDFLCKGVNV